jgi:hypothetical protein
MKYKLKVAMSGPNVDYSVGDDIELTDAQVPAMAEAGYIEIEPSTISKVEKPKKPSKPKKAKAKKTKV